MNNIIYDKDIVEKVIVPRRRAASEIKLLRLELFPKGSSPFQELGSQWSLVQPAETLSPAKAARSLGLELWAPPSVIKKRYQKLQLRYPPDQFMQKHIEWRPSVELLGNPRARLNWFWQSGFVPIPESEQAFSEGSLWDRENAEPFLDCRFILCRFQKMYSHEKN